MQTFLPFPGFIGSAHVLDNRRLGKQRVEAWQILNTLTGRSKGWRHHPAVRMWEGYELALQEYGQAICMEWISRGFRDTMLERFGTRKSMLSAPRPPWIGNERLHSSHRAALLFKDPDHYKKFGWSEEPKMAYWWPTADADYRSKVDANR